MSELLSVEEFAQKIKSKYPEYLEVDDLELTEKVLAKYPVYRDQVDLKKKDVSTEDFTISSEESESETPSTENEVDRMESLIGLPPQTQPDITDMSHIMAMSAINRDPAMNLTMLSQAERNTYDRVYGQWERTNKSIGGQEKLDINPLIKDLVDDIPKTLVNFLNQNEVAKVNARADEIGQQTGLRPNNLPIETIDVNDAALLLKRNDESIKEYKEDFINKYLKQGYSRAEALTAFEHAVDELYNSTAKADAEDAVYNKIVEKEEREGVKQEKSQEAVDKILLNNANKRSRELLEDNPFIRLFTGDQDVQRWDLVNEINRKIEKGENVDELKKQLNLLGDFKPLYSFETGNTQATEDEIKNFKAIADEEEKILVETNNDRSKLKQVYNDSYKVLAGLKEKRKKYNQRLKNELERDKNSRSWLRTMFGEPIKQLGGFLGVGDFQDEETLESVKILDQDINAAETRFLAAARLYGLNENPEGQKKNFLYYTEAGIQAFNEQISLGGLDTPPSTIATRGVMEDVLNEADIEVTPKMKESLDMNFGEAFVPGMGSGLGMLAQFAVLRKPLNLVGYNRLLQTLRKGNKLSKTIGTGIMFHVEGKLFEQVGGDYLGGGSFALTQQFIPGMKFIKNPYLRTLAETTLKPGLGFTAASEVSMVVEQAHTSLIEDKSWEKFSQDIVETYGDIDETSQRLIASFSMGLSFGGKAIYNNMRYGAYWKSPSKLRHTASQLREKNTVDGKVKEDIEQLAKEFETRANDIEAWRKENSLVDTETQVDATTMDKAVNNLTRDNRPVTSETVEREIQDIKNQEAQLKLQFPEGKPEVKTKAESKPKEEVKTEPKEKVKEEVKETTNLEELQKRAEKELQEFDIISEPKVETAAKETKVEPEVKTEPEVKAETKYKKDNYGNSYVKNPDGSYTVISKRGNNYNTYTGKLPETTTDYFGNRTETRKSDPKKDLIIITEKGPGGSFKTMKEAKEARMQDLKDSKGPFLPKKQTKETYKPAEITNVKDPVDVLRQAKERQKKSGLEFKRRSDNKELSEKQKQTFREEATQIQKDIKNLEKLIVEKGFEKTGTQESKTIKEFTDKVVKGLEDAKARLNKQGLTYSFVVPIPPKVLSKALDAGILAVKATGKAAEGLNAFKNFVVRELKEAGPIAKSKLKKLEQQLNDYFTKNYNLQKEGVVNFAKEVIKQKGLDIDGFVKEMQKIPTFSRFDKSDLQKLYRDTSKKLTTTETKEFTKKAAEQTDLTQTQVKKEKRRIEQVDKPKTTEKQLKDVFNNIKEKTEQFVRGKKKGKKQADKERKALLNEFNKYISDNLDVLRKGVIVKSGDMRFFTGIKTEADLQRAIERLDKLINDKKTSENAAAEQKLIDKITETSVAKEKDASGKVVAKRDIRARGKKLAREITSRLDKINKYIVKSTNKNTGKDYEAKQQEKIEEIEAKIIEIESGQSKTKDIAKLEAESIKLRKELFELQFSQINNKNKEQLDKMFKEIKELRKEAQTETELYRQEEAKRFSDLRKLVIDRITGKRGILTGIEAKRLAKKIAAKDIADVIEVWDKNLVTVLKSLDTKAKKGYFLVDTFYKKHVKAAEDAQLLAAKKYDAEVDAKFAEILGVNQSYLQKIALKLKISKPEDISLRQAIKYKIDSEYRDIVDTGIEVINKNTKKPDKLYLTQMEALAKLMEYKDLSNRGNFETMGYTPETIAKLEKFVKPEVQKLGDYLFTQYRKMYKKYNKKYEEVYGVSMPSVGKFYSPRFIEGKGMEKNSQDVIDTQFNNISKTISNGHILKRIKNNEPLLYVDALDVFTGYRGAMERFYHFTSPVRELNAVFGDKNVRLAIQQNHGSAYNKIMDFYVDLFSGNFRTNLNFGFDTSLTNNLTTATLFAKPAIGIKQTFSTLTFMSQMPTGAFLKGLARFDFIRQGMGMKAGIVDIRSGTWLSTRGKDYLDYTSQRTSGFRSTRRSKFRNKFSFIKGKYIDPAGSLFIKYGDRYGAGIGGQVYADYQYKQYRKQINKKTGKKHTHKEAHEKALQDFENFAEISQQSFRLSNTSFARAHGGDLLKPFTMFTSAMIQQNQLATQALREIAAGKNVKRNTKIFVASHVLLGQVFALAGNSFKWDDVRQATALLTGNLEGLFLIGKFVSAAKNALLGPERAFKDSMSPLFDTFINVTKSGVSVAKKSNEIHKIAADEKMRPSEKEEKIIKLEDEIRKEAKKFSKNVVNFTGLPTPGVSGVIEDFGTVLRGETDRPILTILGFENDYTVGGLGTSVLLGGKGVTKEFMQMSKLVNKNRRLQTQIDNAASGKERLKLKEEFRNNSEKIKKLHKEYYNY